MTKSKIRSHSRRIVVAVLTGLLLLLAPIGGDLSVGYDEVDARPPSGSPGGAKRPPATPTGPDKPTTKPPTRKPKPKPDPDGPDAGDPGDGDPDVTPTRPKRKPPRRRPRPRAGNPDKAKKFCDGMFDAAKKCKSDADWEKFFEDYYNEWIKPHVDDGNTPFPGCDGTAQCDALKDLLGQGDFSCMFKKPVEDAPWIIIGDGPMKEYQMPICDQNAGANRFCGYDNYPGDNPYYTDKNNNYPGRDIWSMMANSMAVRWSAGQGCAVAWIGWRRDRQSPWTQCELDVFDAAGSQQTCLPNPRFHKWPDFPNLPAPLPPHKTPTPKGGGGPAPPPTRR